MDFASHSVVEGCFFYSFPPAAVGSHQDPNIVALFHPNSVNIRALLLRANREKSYNGLLYFSFSGCCSTSPFLYNNGALSQDVVFSAHLPEKNGGETFKHACIPPRLETAGAFIPQASTYLSIALAEFSDLGLHLAPVSLCSLPVSSCRHLSFDFGSVCCHATLAFW